MSLIQTDNLADSAEAKDRWLTRLNMKLELKQSQLQLQSSRSTTQTFFLVLVDDYFALSTSSN